MTKIKLLALDLDDSLLDDNLQISPRTAAAVRKAITKGIHITLATGRMFRSALPFARELGLDLPLITYQGALVKTSVTEKIFYLKSVPSVIAKEVIRDLRSEGLPINIYLNDTLYVEQDTLENRKYAEMARVKMHVAGKLDDYIDDTGIEPIKVLGIGEEKKLDDLAVILREKYREKLYITKSKPYFLEFLHPEATKGNGVKAVADFLNISRENTAAVGDSFNDLTMFDYAGLAVVMGNAKEEIKKHADVIIGANYEDGVAEFIENYILKEG